MSFGASSSLPRYIPHPAPVKPKEEKVSAMGATTSLLTTIVIPAIVALSLYLLLSYVVIPLWQRYRGRYSRYIPLETISSQTTNIRQRLQDTLARFLLPSSWRSDFRQGRFGTNGQDESDAGFDDEDGEELLDVENHRREALSLDTRRGLSDDDGRRLSRDLEEGFRDDSDDEDSPTGVHSR